MTTNFIIQASNAVPVVHAASSNIPAYLTSAGGYAGIAAVIAIVVTAWGHITGFVRNLSSILFVKVTLKDDSAKAISAYLNAKAKRSIFGPRVFGGSKLFVNPVQRVEVVGFESFSSESILVWLNKRPIVYGFNGQKDSRGFGEYSSDFIINVSTIRGLFDINKLVLESIDYYNSLHRISSNSGLKCVTGFENLVEKNNRFSITRIGRSMKGSGGKNGSDEVSSRGGHTGVSSDETNIRTNVVRLLNWEIGDIGTKKGKNTAFNVFFFPDYVMEAVKEIRLWLKHEKWFKEKGITWRMGWLLHGKPGTGKSTLVRSIAMDLDLPVYVLDLSGLDNNSFTEAWQEVQQNAPAIALIEDIDNVFSGRANITAKELIDSLTFDCLLNTISGVNNGDGVFLVITTNDISSLDPALGIPDKADIEVKSTRPGRVDRIIELHEMEQTEREKVAKYILSDYPELVEKTIEAGRGESAAQFQSRCTQLALSIFWKDQIKK